MGAAGPAGAAGAAIARWWAMPMSPRAAYAVAAAIGLAAILLVHGPGFVLGTGAYWDMPALDHRSYMMGYRYFLHEDWHWPIFEARTLNVPHPQSIAFNDSLPLWALLNKALATVVPPWRDASAHAFLGLWYALTSVLQAALGVAILRALGHHSRGAAIVTALFFVAIPAWTFRFFHASLYAHFLLLWALYLYLRTPAGAPAPRRLRAAQLAQLGVAALLNPYHTVMSLAVFAASLARAGSWRAAAWLPAGGAVVLAALALAGYFAPEAASSLPGFQLASSNLLGPVLPRRSGWIGEAAWIDPTGLQFEGMCYLGAGLLVLLALAAPRARDAIAAARRHVPLAIVACGAAILALSNHVYLGAHRVLAYPMPPALHWIPDQFRAPGRFSWLPMYVVAIYLLSQAFARLGTGWRRLVLPLLAIAQLVDVTPDWRAWRDVTRAPAPSQLDRAAWRALLAQVDQVRVFPAHACNNDPSFEPATHLQYLASGRALPINGVYSSRAQRDCVADAGALLDFRAEPRTLYVFVSPMTALARRLAAGGLPCAGFGFGEVCHADRALIDGLRWPPTPAPAPLAFGDAIDLTEIAAPHLELGWRWATPAGRWTEGPVARLSLRPVGAPPPDPALWIEASAMLCGARAAQAVDVLVGGVAIGTLQLAAGDGDGDAPRARALPIARPDLLARPIVELELRVRDSRSPRELGCNQDEARLGVRVRRIRIAPAAPPAPAKVP